MAADYPGEERRQFFRHRHEKPLQYKILNINKLANNDTRLTSAVSKNLSVSGMLFYSNKIPKLSSLLMLDLDYRNASICQEIEENALIVNNRLFGKVVRVEDTGSGLYDVGVAFIKKTDDLAETIKNIAKTK